MPTQPSARAAAGATGDVLSVEHVTKSFGAHRVLDAISLTVARGEFISIIGPNGAGKSTLISLCTGIRRPDSGRLKVFGKDPRTLSVRRRIGVMPQSIDFPSNLRVAELIRLVASHFDAPAPIEELAAQTGIDRYLQRQAGGLSGGEARRLALTLAFVGDPELIFLDEPTLALDFLSRDRMWSLLRAYARRGGSALVTNHDLEEVGALSTRLLVLDRARILLDGTIGEVRARFARTRLRFAASFEAARSVFPDVRLETGLNVVEVTDGDAAVRRLVRSDIGFSHLEVRPLHLEEALKSQRHSDLSARDRAEAAA